MIEKKREKRRSTQIEEKIPCFVNHLLSFKNTLFRLPLLLLPSSCFFVRLVCARLVSLAMVGMRHDCVETKAKVVYDVIHTIQTFVNMLCKYVCRYAKLNGIESNWMSDM